MVSLKSRSRTGAEKVERRTEPAAADDTAGIAAQAAPALAAAAQATIRIFVGITSLPTHTIPWMSTHISVLPRRSLDTGMTMTASTSPFFSEPPKSITNKRARKRSVFYDRLRTPFHFPNHQSTAQTPSSKSEISPAHNIRARNVSWKLHMKIKQCMALSEHPYAVTPTLIVKCNTIPVHDTAEGIS